MIKAFFEDEKNSADLRLYKRQNTRDVNLVFRRYFLP